MKEFCLCSLLFFRSRFLFTFKWFLRGWCLFIPSNEYVFILNLFLHNLGFRIAVWLISQCRPKNFFILLATVCSSWVHPDVVDYYQRAGRTCRTFSWQMEWPQGPFGMMIYVYISFGLPPRKREPMHKNMSYIYNWMHKRVYYIYSNFGTLTEHWRFSTTIYILTWAVMFRWVSIMIIISNSIL